MLIFPYTVYNLFTNMAMSTNIIYLNFIFKGMPIRAFVLRDGPPAEDRLSDDRPGSPWYGLASIDGKTLSSFQKGASYGRLFFVSFGILADLCPFVSHRPGEKLISISLSPLHVVRIFRDFGDRKRRGHWPLYLCLTFQYALL